MPDLKFSGASDDLVEVEGVVTEEYNDEIVSLLVVAPDGRQARVHVAYVGGCWSVATRPVDEEIQGFEGRIAFDGYTAELTLDVPAGTKVHRVDPGSYSE